MAAPGIITGQGFQAPEGLPNEPQGRFFSSSPAATPKYAENRGGQRSERVSTMARMIVDLNQSQLTRLLRSLPGDAASAAQTLLYTGDLTSLRNGEAGGAGYFDFLLTQVQQKQQEREQAIDTLTDNTVIYYSGESAPILFCAGYLLNTFQDDQNVWFQLLYNNILRGTQLARRNLVARFRYDSFFMTGYLTNFMVSTLGELKTAVNFSFSFRVKSIQIATPIIYNPSAAQSVFATSVFSSDAVTSADDRTRHGVEGAEQPAEPRALPAASAAAGGSDTRETAATQGVPLREQQERTDRALAQQSTLALAQLPAGAAGAVVDAASTPVVRARGDVRDSLPDIQTFSQGQTAPSTTEDVIDRLEAFAAQQLRPQSRRGTVTVSSTTGEAERSSRYADDVSRAAAGATSSTAAGSVTPTAADRTGEELADVRNPPPALVQALRDKRLKETSSTGLRSRNRPTV